jgi:hypothetical protein
MAESTHATGVRTGESGGARPRRGDQLGVLVIDAPAMLRGLRQTLAAPQAVLGRDGDIRLDSPAVSRRHARIWRADGQVWIADDGSANGTIVNGRRLARAQPLGDGDRIRLGDVEAIFHSGPEWVQDPRHIHREPSARRSDGRHTIPVVAATTRTETTRHLCAAVHLDRQYREQVLDATVREAHRAVAPSPGVDLSVLARHAVLADRRALLRDAALAAVLVVFLTVVLVAAVAVDLVGLVERQDWGRLGADAVRLLPVGLVLLLVAWSVVAAETWVRLSTLADYLRPGGRPETLPQPRAARTAYLLDQLVEVNTGNVVVYSVYAPFVGSGQPADAASYPVPLLAAGDGDDSGRQPVRFGAGELVTALTASLRALELGDVRVDRRLYVGGFDVALVPALLPDPERRPAPWVPASVLDEVTERPTGNVRPYLCIEVGGWQGHLVVTTFVRVVVLTGILFVDTAAYVLPPLRSEYLAVDAMRIRTGPERIGRTLTGATATCLPALVTSPARLGSAAAARRRAAGRDREFRRLLSEDVWVDRGATTSLREEASGDVFGGYFMQLDAVMALSVVRQRVADTVAEFLAARGYRTDKINLIQNNISNIDNSVRLRGVSGNVAGVGPNASGSVSGSPAASRGGGSG